MSIKETINKAYGSVAKEVTLEISFDIFPFRGLKYYWHVLVRKFTR